MQEYIKIMQFYAMLMELYFVLYFYLHSQKLSHKLIEITIRFRHGTRLMILFYSISF